MTQKLNTKGKFRISVSREQMQYILSCPDCPADLRKQLKLALIKADEGMITPAYEIVPKEKKDLSLETQYKMACKYLDRDADIPDDLMPAYNEYRYMNDLMSPEDSKVYELQEGF